MSVRAERPHAARRRGIALLLALITMLVGGTCALALWHTRASTFRALTLERAWLRAATTADSALLAALTLTDTGGWRSVAAPGDLRTLLDITASHEFRRAAVARLGWGTLLVRGVVQLQSGVPHLVARAEHRVLIPLIAPITMPQAGLTGVRPWTVDSAAVLTLSAAVPSELTCRAGLLPVTVLQDSLGGALDSNLVTLLDPDTVSLPLAGVFRLTRDRITRPLVITGMVESVTGLQVAADLRIMGVLVVQESVVPAGGRLDVTGAIVTRDAGVGHSTLGSGDRVRYDACAIRHAVARATRPGPARTWTTLRLF